MGDNSSLVKAEIVQIEPKEKRIKCLFNPKEYTFTKTNSWTADQKTGGNIPQLNFGGGQPATLTMELFFDTFAVARDGGDPKDVRKEYTDEVWKLMETDDHLKDKKTKKSRPPKVRFQWGSVTFTAVITSLTQKFTLFLPNGTPVRATMNVTFQQVQDPAQKPKTNPTSGGAGGERVWTVSEGDTLGWIAYQEYGDTSRWRLIAEANQLAEVRRLMPGMVLVIPNG